VEASATVDRAASPLLGGASAEKGDARFALDSRVASAGDRWPVVSHMVEGTR
jgi:hypothetical protein